MLRFTPVSQQKKFASHLGTFSFGNRKGTCTRYCFPVIASNISLTFVGTLYLTIGWDVLQGGKFGNWNSECGIKSHGSGILSILQANKP